MNSNDKQLDVAEYPRQDPTAFSPVDRSEKDIYGDTNGSQLSQEVVLKITRVSSTMSVLVSGIALFSDGYNAQIIGYMQPLFKDL